MSKKPKKSTSILGDALQVLDDLPKHFFDACIADPPYNMSKRRGLAWAFSSHVTMQERWDQFSKDDYLQFSLQWMSKMCRVVKPNGNLFVFGTFHNIYALGSILNQLDRRILNSIIWIKPNAQPNITCRMLTESTEQIIWACNDTNKKASRWTFDYPLAKKMNGDKQMRNSWIFPLTPRSERVAGHPTQKPEGLMERMVLLFTRPGDWLLDPFAGVGTTGVAALKHGREVVLIEKEAKYVKAQQERLQRIGLKSKMGFTEAKRMKTKAKEEVSLSIAASELGV
jgi:site-specific DNA-methyltransferase (adenine-specific)